MRIRCAFTLIELLVVLAIMALLVGILLPTLGSARASARTVLCLANVRSLALSQQAYAVDHHGHLVKAGSGSYLTQGSWIGQLDRYSDSPLARRCPSDQSVFFSQPLPSSSPPAFRSSSYAINNFVSPTHTPAGADTIDQLDDVVELSAVVQFAELAEAGAYAGADHLHVESFYSVFLPDQTLARIAQQLPLGRHGNDARSWDAPLNYSFLDGHAETRPIGAVYTHPNQNAFDPRARR